MFGFSKWSAKYRTVRPSKTVRLDLFASENKKLETDTKGVLENLKTAKLTQIRKQSSAARQVHFVVSRFWLFYKTRRYNRGTRNRAFTPKSVKCATFRANCATLNVVNSRTDTCNNNNVRLQLWISRYWSTCKKSAARPFIFSSGMVAHSYEHKNRGVAWSRNSSKKKNGKKKCLVDRRRLC